MVLFTIDTYDPSKLLMVYYFGSFILIVFYIILTFNYYYFIHKIHDGIKLKISTNCVRRVRWYTKLGFYKNCSLPIPISLESVLPRGGLIGSLSLVILRKYSMMYFERKKNLKSSKYTEHNTP